jgi:hypothetical protein
MDDLNEYNCPSCGANSNHKSIIIAFEVKIAELEKERDRESLKKEHAFKRERYLIAENLELKKLTFRFYNDEEYWIFQDDGEDYADSLVCPVVMSADQFRRLLNLELNIEFHKLEQQAKGFDYASNKLTEQQGAAAAPILEMFNYFKNDLLRQAKALKESK